MWDGGPVGVWNLATNWDPDAVPTSSDDTTIAAGNPTVTVNQPSFAKRLGLGGTGSSIVGLEINSSLEYDDPFGQFKFGVAGDTVTVNINNGGTLDGGGSGGASRIDGTGTINVNAGGTLTNIYRQRVGLDVVLNGGLFELSAANNGSRIGGYGLNNGSISGSSGTLIFAANGNDSNTAIGSSAGVDVDIDDLTLQFDILGSYVPQVGDTFDITGGSPGASGSIDIGDGSNISQFSRDGRYRFEYNLSNFNPNGNGKGEVTLTSVSEVPVPEPASLALLGLGGLVMLTRRRKGG